MSMPEQPNPPGFESDLEELEKVVRQLESGDLPLEQSLVLFEKGMSLSDACRKRLDEAETRIEILLKRGGKVSPQPWQPDKA